MKRRAACIAAAWVSMRRRGPTWGDANRAFYGAPGCLVVALVAPCAYGGTPAGARGIPHGFRSLCSRVTRFVLPIIRTHRAIPVTRCEQERERVSIPESHRMNHTLLTRRHTREETDLPLSRYPRVLPARESIPETTSFSFITRALSKGLFSSD